MERGLTLPNPARRHTFTRPAAGTPEATYETLSGVRFQGAPVISMSEVTVPAQIGRLLCDLLYYRQPCCPGWKVQTQFTPNLLQYRDVVFLFVRQLALDISRR